MLRAVTVLFVVLSTKPSKIHTHNPTCLLTIVTVHGYVTSKLSSIPTGRLTEHNLESEDLRSWSIQDGKRIPQKQDQLVYFFPKAVTKECSECMNKDDFYITSSVHMAT